MNMALTDTNRESRSLELLHTALRLSTLALAAVAIAANFTDYGPLIPLLQRELRITPAATGLLSTLLYVGIGLSYLPGGWLADRYGSRRVLFGSLLLVEAGGCLLPLIPNLAWMMLCRFVIGLGAGAAIVAGSQAARGGKYSAFGQGLFGGAMQLGAGLGLFATPTLQGLFGWRGTFTAWGALGLTASVLCLLALSGEAPQPAGAAPRRITAAFRFPSLWTIGLVHLGTLGLGQAIAPWLAVYFSLSYGLPLGLAAVLGAVGLLAGMIFRPLGGVLLSRRVFTSGALMRTGTALACAGVIMLALPLHAPLLTGWGLALFAFGTTFPYAAVFDEAGRIGAENSLGSGTAQGIVSVISAPASAFGPLLIGGLLGQHGNFALPFGAIVLLGGVAFVAALFIGTIFARTRDAVNLPRLRAWEPDAYLAQALASRPGTPLPASTLPSIVALGAFSRGEGAAIIRRLQHAGGLPLVLPPAPSPAQGEAGDLLADEGFFREIFERRIWPLFCQLLLGQTRGLCLVEEGQESEKTNGAHAIDTGDLLQREASDPWSAITQRYLALMAWLVGMPVLGAGWELQSLQLNYRVDEREGTVPKRLWPLPANPAVCSGSVEGTSVFSQFVAACAVYTPPSPQALAPFRDEIFGWLRRRDRALVRQMYRLQLASGQGTTGMFEALEPAPAPRPVEQEVVGKAGSRKEDQIAA
jgi:cyanate permease